MNGNIIKIHKQLKRGIECTQSRFLGKPVPWIGSELQTNGFNVLQLTHKHWILLAGQLNCQADCFLKREDFSSLLSESVMVQNAI